MGKTSVQNKRNRDLSTSLKERFDDCVSSTVDYIIRDETAVADNSLERSMACLFIAMSPGKKTRIGDPLVSFKYVAGSVCLKEVERAVGQLI